MPVPVVFVRILLIANYLHFISFKTLLFKDFMNRTTFMVNTEMQQIFLTCNSEPLINSKNKLVNFFIYYNYKFY